MNSNEQKLIIIRGNSGSGKSTLAKELRSQMVQQGMKTALIEQDYLRRIVLKEKEISRGDNIDLIEQMVEFALKRGYSVVLEGIFVFARYGVMLERLIFLAGRSFVTIWMCHLKRHYDGMLRSQMLMSSVKKR